MKRHYFLLFCGLLITGSQVMQAEAERRRSLPGSPVDPPASATGFSAAPADKEFFKHGGLELPLVPRGDTTVEENIALAEALTLYESAGATHDFSPIDAFLEDYPDSPWRVALLTNKALAYRYQGFIGGSFPIFEEVWQLARDADHPSLRAYAERAIAELIAVKAGLGRQDELEALFAQIEGRPLTGRNAELVANARMGLASMRSHPERSFNCGPAALVSVLSELGHPAAADERIMAEAATSDGLSLQAVASLAERVGFAGYRLAFRESSQAPYPTPSILHWQEDHFSALLREENDRYLIQDPTLGRAVWIPREALEAETSGYFLLAGSELPTGWRAVESAEAARIYGKGKTTLFEDGSTSQDDHKACADSANPGMPGYNVHLLLCSLNITDTPLWVAASYGRPIAFTVTHNQRETSLPDPALALHGNMGANWTHNWQSWTLGSGSLVSGVGHQSVSIALPGGGLKTFELNDTQTAYKQQRDTQAMLTASYNGSTLAAYLLTHPDGSIQTYGLSKASGSETRYFLTEIIDPHGNTITLNYDADYRLATVVTDALPTPALTFVYQYDSNGDPVVPAAPASAPGDYLVKEVVGPQGRYASFSYDTQSRIDGITDMAGVEAGFDYGTSYLSLMHTPYGSTSFTYPSDASVSRAIVITDPAGQQERVEFTRAVDVVSLWGSESTPPGAAKGPHFNDDLNTFHWDKRAMETAVNPDGSMDYTQAKLYHWMEANDGTQQIASGVLHSVKRPLENRDWYIYPDTFGGNLYTIGSTNKPTAVKRYVEDETGATVLRTVAFEHNELGLPTRAVDPLGREVKMSYAPNGLDLLQVEQRTGPGATDFELLSDFDYDADNDGFDDFPRLPSLIEGADGVRLDMTYNSKGQILSVTRKVPDGQGGHTDEGTTDYTYVTSGTGETYGYLQKVEGPALGGQRPTTTYTYDAYGRVETATDTDDFTLTYAYDDLDRVTRVTYPDGTFVAQLYEPFSEGLDLIGSIDRMGRLTQFRHDALGRVVQSIDPKGQSTTYQWCGCGSLNALTDPLGQTTTWLRDVQGRVEKKIYPDNSEINYSYQPESGRLSTVTDPRGYEKTFKYFVDGNLAEIAHNDGSTADPDYIDAPTVNYTYDPYFNRTATLTTEGDPDDYAYQYYGFTGDGNANRLETVTIEKLRDATSVSHDIDFTYDPLGRRHTRSFRGDTETYLYDDLDRLETLSDPLGDFDYSYDELTARILAVQHSVGGVDGLRTDLAYQSKVAGGQQRKVPFLEGIHHTASGGATLASHHYQRNENGWIDHWQQHDGSAWQSHSYRYDQAGQLETARKHDGLDANSPLLERNDYRYDRAGNRRYASAEASGVGGNDSHNALNQLTVRSGEGSTLFHGTLDQAGKAFVQQLDGGGNVLQSEEAQLYSGNEFYADLDLPVGTHTIRITARDIHGETTTQDYSVEVDADPGDSFTFDAAGNLTHWTKADGTEIEYKWDAANRLRGIEVDSVLIQSFEFDGAGRMTRATDASDIRNDYYWDGLERLSRENVDVSPTVYRRYLTQGFTERLDGALPSKYYVTRDHLGSTREVLDDAYAVVAKYDYSAWGEVSKVSGSMDADQLYTGHLYFADSDTPLHLAPYRAYQPELGRWLSRDFLGETGPDGSNTYSYSRNNPINESDPTGLASSLNTPSGQALMAYLYFEAASTAVDVAEAAKVIASDCSNRADVVNALGAVALGMIAPGPGTAYTKAASGTIDAGRVLATNNTPTPNLRTGVGYDAGDVPVRIDGDWSINDMKQALLGHPPRGLGSPDIHHGGQMPGGALHEVLPQLHRNNSALHPNKFNQGVTREMRASDRQLHWWYRAREQGADELLPDWIYD